MNVYEKLLEEFSEELIIDDNADLPFNIKGFYSNKNNSNVILLNKEIKTSSEKACILAEELGHHYTTTGDITDQSKVENRKQEYKARTWAIRKFIRIEQLIDAFNAGIRNKFELAEFLEVPETFLDMALEHFKGIYGMCKNIDEYIIYFDPLYIYKQL